jgi:GTP cyclohydrolase II
VTVNYEHAESVIETIYGSSTLHCYSFGPHEEDNVLVVDCLDRGSPDRPLIRIQSACYTGEIFRSTDCDCHEQLDVSLTRIHDEGGALIYMICDGRGAGLLTKVRGLALGRSEGLDTHDAYAALGVEVDPRDYTRVNTVASALGLQKVRLLTNNARKVEGLQKAGVDVVREPLEIPPTAASLPYLRTKATKMDHLLNLESEQPESGSETDPTQSIDQQLE